MSLWLGVGHGDTVLDVGSWVVLAFALARFEDTLDNGFGGAVEINADTVVDMLAVMFGILSLANLHTEASTTHEAVQLSVKQCAGRYGNVLVPADNMFGALGGIESGRSNEGTNRVTTLEE